MDIFEVLAEELGMSVDEVEDMRNDEIILICQEAGFDIEEYLEYF